MLLAVLQAREGACRGGRSQTRGTQLTVEVYSRVVGMTSVVRVQPMITAAMSVMVRMAMHQTSHTCLRDTYMHAVPACKGYRHTVMCLAQYPCLHWSAIGVMTCLVFLCSTACWLVNTAWGGSLEVLQFCNQVLSCLLAGWWSCALAEGTSQYTPQGMFEEANSSPVPCSDVTGVQYIIA